MPELVKSVKRLKDQTRSDKMYVLKQMAYHMLGAKWKYYHKIKSGGKGISLLKEKSLMEQMKATQSALKFTSKSAKSSYRTTYQSTLNDITVNTGLKKDLFPALPETESGKEPPSLTSQFDEVIISWTPLKFFLPAKKIREKGKATQRHTEGLIAKLFFKVAAFYATPENWNSEKLSIYVRRIDADTSYQDVVSILEPLKTDLNQFADAYQPFKFGKASLTKGAGQETDTFDDAMAVESFESQVKSLYWYSFIYHAVEAFIFRYYLVLITSTVSTQAVRYITMIFEPILEKVIENTSVFLGSFEIDRSKKQYREPFHEYQQKRLEDPRSTKLKTRNGIFETYVYNLPLLEDFALSFTLSEKPKPDSAWSKFIQQNWLGIQPDLPDVQEEDIDAELDEIPLPEIPLELKEYSFMQLLAVLVNCTQFRRKARHNILERFKKRVVADKEFAEVQIKEVRKKGEKKLAKLERKAAKIKRLKQEEAAQAFDKDIEQFRKKLDDRCNAIRQLALKELNTQKQRLQILFKQISKEESVSPGLASNLLYHLLKELDKEDKFTAKLLERSVSNIQFQYSKELEPFYENIFEILDPSIQEKIVIIQALKKSGGEKSINLTLTEQEEAEFENMVTELKAKIEGNMPDIFSSKIVLQTSSCEVDDLFQISIDNQSLKRLLTCKLSLPNTGKQVQIQQETAKAMLMLNKVMNPVPKNNLIMEGKEKETNPQKSINTALFNKLLNELS